METIGFASKFSSDLASVATARELFHYCAGCRGLHRVLDALIFADCVWLSSLSSSLQISDLFIAFIYLSSTQSIVFYSAIPTLYYVWVKWKYGCVDLPSSNGARGTSSFIYFDLLSIFQNDTNGTICNIRSQYHFFHSMGISSSSYHHVPNPPYFSCALLWSYTKYQSLKIGTMCTI